MDARALERYRWRLFNRLPLIGGWLRRGAARALARAGSTEAMRLLAQAVAVSPDAGLRRMAADILGRRDSQAAIDAVAVEWAQTRHPELEGLLCARGLPPSGPPGPRLLAALRLGQVETAARTDAEGVPSLIAACKDSDGALAATARRALAALSDAAAVQALADSWLASRDPMLEEPLVAGRQVAASYPARLWTALKVDRLDAVRHLPAVETGALVLALEDADQVIREGANRLAEALTSADAKAAFLDHLCSRWAETRSADFEARIVAGRVVASAPAPVRILSALKTGQPELLADLGESEVVHLVAACHDRDPVIASAAPRALRGLRRTDAREMLCRLVLERDDPVLAAAAAAVGHVPADPYRRALFLFLTEQWDRYASFDFDHRLLAAVHETADEATRRRIADKMRAAGRTDFLVVLAGRDYRARAAQMAADEATFLVRMLTANREWSRLWGLAFELPLRQSVRIVRTLAQHGWQPDRADDRAALAQLAVLAADERLAEADLAKHLPPAVRRAHVRVRGNVNGVAFAPVRPFIALGTGKRKLVLWDFQRGEQAALLEGFDRSIAHVAFTAGGILVCAERVRPGEKCPLHLWPGEKHLAVTLGDEVKALVAAGGDHVLTACRDHTVALLNAQTGAAERDARFDDWCRAARVAADGTRALLLHEGVTLIGLPELSVLATAEPGRGVSRCAAIGADAMLAGQHNGQVLVYHVEGAALVSEPHRLLTHPRELRAVEWIDDGKAVLTASADGTIEFTAWPGRARLGRLHVAGRRLTSLHLSPGGEFMAAGDSDQSMSLWDLRPLTLPPLLTGPLAHALPRQLAAVNALVGEAYLPPLLGQSLRFVQGVLQHRFRYDIEVADVPTMKAGDFDIEVE